MGASSTPTHLSTSARPTNDRRRLAGSACAPPHAQTPLPEPHRPPPPASRPSHIPALHPTWPILHRETLYLQRPAKALLHRAVHVLETRGGHARHWPWPPARCSFHSEIPGPLPLALPIRRGRLPPAPNQAVQPPLSLRWRATTQAEQTPPDRYTQNPEML